MSRRKLIIGLMVSISFNCAFIGLVLGDHFFARPRLFGSHVIEQLKEILPESAVPAVSLKIRENRLELLKSLYAFRQARIKVQDLANQHPLSRPALEQAFAELRQVTEQTQHKVHDVILSGLDDYQNNPAQK